MADYTLGPQDEDLKENGEGDMPSSAHIPAPLPPSHPNAFHLWDQDDVMIPLPQDESLQSSPLLTVVPYIPNFFNSPPLPHALLPHTLLPHVLLPRSHLPRLPEVWSPNKIPPDNYFYP